MVVLVMVGMAGKYLYMKPRYQTGENLPDFSSTTLSGDPFQLSDLRGSYVLLDFWGSWCAPCRAESPQLVALHRKYGGSYTLNGSGFHIVSVGIEPDRSRWQRAVQRDGLDWPYHVIDQADNLRFFDSPIAQQFGVREVPARYLLDPAGAVIMVNPSFEALERLLNGTQ